MDLFLTILLKLLPLYALIGFGYLAGKRLGAQGHTVAALLFYILLPMLIFTGVMRTKIDTGVLLLPVLLFFISSFLAIATYRIAGLWWKDSSKNVLGLSAGNGNTGYFGIPVAMMFFDEKTLGIYIMALLGVTLYENSIGYYITARGRHTGMESLKKICKLPSLYAFLAGLTLNQLQVEIPSIFADFVTNIRGAYSLLGMMMIGIGLSTIKSFKPDFKFLAVAFTTKFVAWPLLAFAVITADTMWLHLLSQPIYHALFIISIVPMAANTVVIATLLHAQPEKIAFAVLLSTLFGLFFVPFMASWYLT